jgi:hypothetical protein
MPSGGIFMVLATEKEKAVWGLVTQSCCRGISLRLHALWVSRRLMHAAMGLSRTISYICARMSAKSTSLGHMYCNVTSMKLSTSTLYHGFTKWGRDSQIADHLTFAWTSLWWNVTVVIGVESCGVVEERVVLSSDRLMTLPCLVPCPLSWDIRRNCIMFTATIPYKNCYPPSARGAHGTLNL